MHLHHGAPAALTSCGDPVRGERQRRPTPLSWLTCGRRTVLAMLTGAGMAVLAGCAGEGQTGLGLNLVSPEQVQQLGIESWQKLRAETPPSDNATYQAALRKVSNRLLTAAGENPGAWEAVVFKGDAANAFALPGNKIGVYEGLFRVAENEEQLAVVVGHEIAHNQQNHAAERLNSTMATQMGVQLVGVALGATGYGNPNAIAALLGAGAQYGLILPYGRNQELEADRLGLLLVARAGYDPREAVRLWRNMASTGTRQPEFLSTHPGPENRIAQLERLMPEAMAIYQRGR